MKVVYFGTDVFLSCFLYFVQNHEVMALYTYHNDEDYFTEYAIVKEAKKRKIPVYYEDMTEEETKRLFEKEGCQLFFSAEYNRIIPVPENMEQFRGINIHSSLLPVGRSYYPIEAAMERHLAHTGVTMHKLAKRLDGGDILDSYEVDISDQTDSIDVYLQCAYGAEIMLKRLMDHFEEGWDRAKKQYSSQKYPYWKRPDEKCLTIHHEMTGEEAMECFRCYNQMTQVAINSRYYFIRGMNMGMADLKEDVRWIDQDRVLYRVKDGHLRLIVHVEREE